MGSIHDQVIVSKTLTETKTFAGDLAASVQRGVLPRVVCLYGTLGAGKTAFAQGFIRALGVKGRILSPTFIVTRQYPYGNGKMVYHADCYRIDDAGDPAVQGIREVLAQSDSIILIEWAERIVSVLPEERLDIRCTANVDGTHGYIATRPL